MVMAHLVGARPRHHLAVISMCDCSRNCNCNYFDRATDGLFFGLGNFQNLRGLGDTTIRAGSKARVGFRYSCSFCLDTGLDPPMIENTIEGCLYASGAFNTVKATVSTGLIYQDYVAVEVTTVFDFGKAEDIGGFIQEKIKECFPNFAGLIDGRDPTLVDAVPVGTPIPTMQVPASAQAGAGSGECSAEKGLNYAACLLGLKPSQGVYVGVIGTLAAMLVLTKVFK